MSRWRPKPSVQRKIAPSARVLTCRKDLPDIDRRTRALRGAYQTSLKRRDRRGHGNDTRHGHGHGNGNGNDKCQLLLDTDLTDLTDRTRRAESRVAQRARTNVCWGRPLGPATGGRPERPFQSFSFFGPSRDVSVTPPGSIRAIRQIRVHLVPTSPGAQSQCRSASARASGFRLRSGAAHPTDAEPKRPHSLEAALTTERRDPCWHATP